MDRDKEIALQRAFAAEQRRAEAAEKKMGRMRELASIDGFYKAYFKLVPEAGGREKAFETINNEFYELYGYWRYSDYRSFRNTQNYRTQNRNK